jgi:hypothetical protein
MSQKNRNNYNNKNNNKNNTKKNYYKKNPPIPTKLQIVVETNLPKFKKFKYDPQLTLPSAPSHNVYFYPLQSLDKDIIKKIPRKSRTLEFFNSQMFHKLNYYTSLFRPRIKTLKEATEKGIVDKNINITLETLFPTNQIFYINREKYYIEFFEWQEGNWTLETSDPKLYSEGELYGPNYNKPSVKTEFESQSNVNIENQKVDQKISSSPDISDSFAKAVAVPVLDADAIPITKNPDLSSGGRTRRKYLNQYPYQYPYKYPYYYQNNPTYNFRNYTNKKYRPRIKKYYRGPNYKINIYISLKKGEKLTEEELKKIPCKKKWKNITNSYKTVIHKSS